ALETQVLEGLAHRGMANFVGGLARFDLSVNNAEAMFEKRRQVPASQITVFVDAGGKNGAAVLAIPGWIISAPAEKRDAKGSAANNHRVLLMNAVWLVQGLGG